MDILDDVSSVMIRAHSKIAASSSSTDMECLRFNGGHQQQSGLSSSSSSSSDGSDLKVILPNGGSMVQVLEFGSLMAAEAAEAARSGGSDDDFEVPYTDWFCWFFEGVLLLVIGIVGLIGNALSVYFFFRQKTHKAFHNLLLTLAVFDTVYVVCAILLFSVSKFSDEYGIFYRMYLLPYLLPMAHIGLMGSVYFTLALSLERYLNLKNLRNGPCFQSSWKIIPPVVAFVVSYNVPRFFEFYVETEIVDGCFSDYDDDEDDEEVCSIERLALIKPTSLRTDPYYGRIYVQWMTLLVEVVVPFAILVYLNLKTLWIILEHNRKLAELAPHVRRRNRGDSVASTSTTESVELITPQQQQTNNVGMVTSRREAVREMHSSV